MPSVGTFLVPNHKTNIRLCDETARVYISHEDKASLRPLSIDGCLGKEGIYMSLLLCLFRVKEMPV